MRNAIYLFAAMICAGSASAQHSGLEHGSQSISLRLEDAIEIAPAVTGDAMASFSTFSDFDDAKFFTNGAVNTQGDQDVPDQFQWVVKSTRNFNVWVRAENPVDPTSYNFHYQGLSSKYNVMSLTFLKMKVAAQNTGSNSTVPNYSGWTSLEKGSPSFPNGKLLIQNGQQGVRDFKTVYKINPAYQFAAGTYLARVVYTATQL